MLYTITTPFGTITRKRRDDAAFQLRQAAYQALEANGQLDTLAGHKWYAEVNRTADSIASGALVMEFGSNWIPTAGKQQIKFKTETGV